jgi:hypothetical protein
LAGAVLAYAVAAGCEDVCGGEALVGAILLFFGTPVASGYFANAMVGEGKRELVYSAP